MVEIHNSVAKIYEENKETLEIFECLDEFSDTQNFCDHYGFNIEDSCNAILIKAKKPEEFYAMFCVLGANRLDVNHKAKEAMGAKRRKPHHFNSASQQSSKHTNYADEVIYFATFFAWRLSF